MSDLKICIIGAGVLSSRRIYPYIGVAGARLMGICDLDVEKAERNSQRYGGKVYQEFEKMLSEQKPDGVMICIGPEAHAKLSSQILKMGYPVYTEKPPAASPDEAFLVSQIAKETGLLCTTAFKSNGWRNFQKRTVFRSRSTIARVLTPTIRHGRVFSSILPSMSSISPNTFLATSNQFLPLSRDWTPMPSRFVLPMGR